MQELACPSCQEEVKSGVEHVAQNDRAEESHLLFTLGDYLIDALCPEIDQANGRSTLRHVELGSLADYRESGNDFLAGLYSLPQSRAREVDWSGEEAVCEIGVPLRKASRVVKVRPNEDALRCLLVQSADKVSNFSWPLERASKPRREVLLDDRHLR